MSLVLLNHHMKQLSTCFLLATLLISACQPIQAPATMQRESATIVAHAAMHPPQLSPQQAAELVTDVTHLRVKITLGSCNF